MNLLKALVIANRPVAKKTYLMELGVEAKEFQATPGQFVMIRVTGTTDPLLRRAFSVSLLTKPNIVHILYRVVGKATELMKNMERGAELDLLGPLGNGFELPPDRKKAIVLIGGGIGIAPLLFLASELRAWEIKFMAGFGSKEDVVDLDEVQALLATEDGSHGYRGSVTELFEAELKKGLPRDLEVYSCGPWGMLKTVARICKEHDLDCQVSLESAMACGLGACQGCAVKALGEDAPTYYHVCGHGPVFRASEIDWGT